MLIKTKEQFTRYEDIEQEISFPYFGISKEKDDFGLRTYYTLLKIQYFFPERSYGQFILTRIKSTLNHGDSAFSASWDDVRIELEDCSAFVLNGSTPFLPSSYYKEMRCMDEEVSEEEFNKVASSILAQYGSLQLI